MIDFANLTPNQKILVNAVLVSGISMFSIFATQPFSFNILYAGFVAGILTGLIQLQKSIIGSKLLMLV